MGTYEALVRQVESISMDKAFMLQERLDIVHRERTSLFPWRGQFSPQLIDFLLETYTTPNSVIFDPFLGSGTTVFESMRLGLECYGTEVNPAAVEFAKIVRFSNLSEFERKSLLSFTDEIIARHTSNSALPGLFDDLGQQHKHGQPLLERFVSEIDETHSTDEFVYNLLAVTLMLAMGDGRTLTESSLKSAYRRSREIVQNLSHSTKHCEAQLRDARICGLQDSSVDLIVTSPPYINVFNYHQNYRPAIEALGWKVLRAAPSEIGANRKHRVNRFLTVVQYCMDMGSALVEMNRVLKRTGRAVIVVGRESKVRGVAFQNGRLLGLLALGIGGFAVERWQERQFVNRFGVTIYEDLLTLKPVSQDVPSLTDVEEFGRLVGSRALEGMLHAESVTTDVVCEIKSAIDGADRVGSSPILQPANNLRSDRSAMSDRAMA